MSHGLTVNQGDTAMLGFHLRYSFRWVPFPVWSSEMGSKGSEIKYQGPTLWWHELRHFAARAARDELVLQLTLRRTALALCRDPCSRWTDRNHWRDICEVSGFPFRVWLPPLKAASRELCLCRHSRVHCRMRLPSPVEGTACVRTVVAARARWGPTTQRNPPWQPGRASDVRGWRRLPRNCETFISFILSH